jgi:hypothetical protein
MRQLKSVLKINTRPKDLENNRNLKCRAIELNIKMVESHFSLPLQAAAKQLGIALTTLKWYEDQQLLFLVGGYIDFIFYSSACRKMGIRKWPYRKVHRLLCGQM